MAKANPLNRIPPAADIRARLEWMEAEVRQLRVLLHIAEQLELAAAPQPAVLVTCAEQHKHIVDQLHAAFDAGDFDGVAKTIEQAKKLGVRIKLNIAPGIVWDSDSCEMPTQADFEAVGRDLAVKQSAEAWL